jgi:4-hydroxy-2-oxoheptanedioate aldolase
MRENVLKKKWQAGEKTLNAWLTIPSAWTAELMANAGFDSVTIDMQHGLMDYATTLAMLQAISTTATIPLARIPWNDPAIIMRLLDAGCYGIVCPMINTRAEADAFVQACRYPPLGQRSYGPIRANVYAGDDYFQAANDTVLTFAMIETKEAIGNLKEIAATPGLDGLYVGTVDLSISLGLPEKTGIGNKQIAGALRELVNMSKAHGLVIGIHLNGTENTSTLADLGFDMLTVTNDTPLLRNAAQEILAETKETLKK